MQQTPELLRQLLDKGVEFILIRKRLGEPLGCCAYEHLW